MKPGEWKEWLFSLMLVRSENNSWDFLGGPVVKTPRPLQEARVRSLVREISLLCGTAKKRKKENNSLNSRQIW